jgi:hypothetical protein
VKGQEHTSYLKFLRNGNLDNQEVNIDVPIQQGKAGSPGAAIALDPAQMQPG